VRSGYEATRVPELIRGAGYSREVENSCLWFESNLAMQPLISSVSGFGFGPSVE
jgi:hypothetical protein